MTTRELPRAPSSRWSSSSSAWASWPRQLGATIGRGGRDARRRRWPKQVIDDDDQIDDLYLRIDHGILELLALQSPVAADLRLVSAILHSCLHLERIGDQAVNVAKLYLATKDAAGQRDDAPADPRDGGHRGLDAPHGDGGLRASATSSSARSSPAMDDPVDRLNREHPSRGPEAGGRSAQRSTGACT